MLAFVFAAQAVDLALCIAWHGVAAAASLPLSLLRALLVPQDVHEHGDDDGGKRDGVVFYEGQVFHARRAPVTNSFRYPVRIAVVNLDGPPPWFAKQAGDHFSADEARAYAGTRGRVRLLTNPLTFGYTQNPISVYYCYDVDGKLQRCIAEVTNTPWNERVRFVFCPQGASVRKSLHVSPFMDMDGTWQLTAEAPGDTLRLVVRVSHPKFGRRFFHADLSAVRSSRPGTPSEDGGLSMLLKFGYAPHRIAVWIYYQAVVLACKGLPLYGLPSHAIKARAENGASHVRNEATGSFFTWSPAPRWPWNAPTTGGAAAAPHQHAAVCPMSGASSAPGSSGCPFARKQA